MSRRRLAYETAFKVLERLGEGIGGIEVLDVGGGSPPDAPPGVRVTELVGDVDPGNGAGFSPFEFDDGAFDYVVSVDVYDLLPPEDREPYLSELHRLARGGVVVSATFDTEAVRAAERLVRDLRRSFHLKEDARLREHASHGLPNLDHTRSLLQGEKEYPVHVLPRDYLPRWLATECLDTFVSNPANDSSGDEGLHETFASETYDTGPRYGHTLVCLKEGSRVDVDTLREPVEEAFGDAEFSGALYGMLPVVARLARLESSRVSQEKRVARSEGALALREAQVGDLSRRFAELVNSENARQVHMRNLRTENNQLKNQLLGITGSRAWRLMTAQRKVRSWFKSGRA